ncbi:MAG: bi-domain-containing oxidoreductase [Chitinophagales bacterium]
MKQLIQHLQSGKTILEDVPSPALKPGHVLIRTTTSLVSTGTEKMLVEFSKANLITKARQNPDRVAQVLDKIKTDGLLPTLDAVFRRLDEPLPLGYCNVGEVVAIADDIKEFKIGDRVASNGTHAEFVCVPKNLVALIPENVSDEEAAFTVVGSIALEAIRLAKPQIGDTVAVIGLGLIGLITCQLLKASGCHVVAFDIAPEKIQIAKSLQIEAYNTNTTSIESISEIQNNGLGFDVIFIAASAKNDNLINIAARATKKRGHIILIGVIDLNLERSEFYKKEILFQVSCSYGPGRYDEQYEQQGIDYPEAYVKWTAKRNFETVLKALATKQIAVTPLITQKTAFENVITLYDKISDAHTIAAIITYSGSNHPAQRITVTQNIKSKGKTIAAIIGAGNFSKITLLPALSKTGVYIKYISGNDGLDVTDIAKKHSIHQAITDNQIILNDPDVNFVIIATRHDTHAELTAQFLAAGKHVFVEKPLALNLEQLEQITAHYTTETALFAGFNRRHAPLAVKAKSLVGDNMLANIIITINAGKLPDDHWLYNKKSGGGRLIGEACHFFDLMSYFTGSLINTVYATDAPVSNHLENTIIHLTYKNGSHGTINYLANGSKQYPKEKIEIFVGNKVIVIDNFKSLKTFGVTTFKNPLHSQDKGHDAQFAAVIDILENGKSPYTSFESLKNTTLATFAAEESIATKKVIEID